MSLDKDVLARHEVRLFPSVRISSGREAELRATASLLAIAKAVSEFGRAVVKMADGPSGRLDCYTEIPISNPDPDVPDLRPDGLLIVKRGKTVWRAFVEVKVGDNPLEQAQFDAYHSLAKIEAVDAIITVSYQAALPNGLPPLTVDKRRLRTVSVTHISWERLLSEARLLSRKNAVSDPDQQWMLEEWIQYLADPASQIIEPPQLGEHWAAVLKAAREGSLQAASKKLADVVERWDSFQRKAALRLRAKLGVDVQPAVSRADKADPSARLKRLYKDALENRCLTAMFKIPDAAGNVSVMVLLAGRAVRYSVAVEAPTHGRVKTRLSWLSRQLKGLELPPNATVSVRWDQRGVRTFGEASKVVDDVTVLLRTPEGRPVADSAVPRMFEIESASELVRGRGRSSAPVLEGIAAGLEAFYKGVVENLKAYVPPAPRLASKTDEIAIPATPVAPPKPHDEPPAGTETAHTAEGTIASPHAFQQLMRPKG